MVTSNLFFNRGPIRDPEQFFGRKAEIRYLCDLLVRGQSVAISGQRRLGKTSLLLYAAAPSVAAYHGLDPANTHWVYLDGGMFDGLSEEWLYGAIDRGMGYEAKAIPLLALPSIYRRPPYVAFA